jgi:hypothetical protein
MTIENKGGSEPAPNPLETLRDYSIALKRHLNDTDYALSHGLDLFNQGYKAVNNALAAAGRPDIAIVTPYEGLMPVGHPHDIVSDTNNFAPKFRMVNKFGAGIGEAKPLSREEILGLRKLPANLSYDAELDLIESNQLPGHSVFTHTPRPAFIRMINLFPDFTANLITGISKPESRGHYERYEAGLFAAYQLMSRLVDCQDRDVQLSDGSLNPYYLMS